MSIFINQATSPEELENCFAIRKRVFVEGQNVPLHEEMDGKDQDSSHYLLWIDNQPVGVTRVRFIGDYAKLERVAILETHQGKGYGNLLMQKILADLQNNPTVKMVKLSSQVHAVPFYEKLGFTICSDTYLDAGILHLDMKYPFN